MSVLGLYFARCCYFLLLFNKCNTMFFVWHIRLLCVHMKNIKNKQFKLKEREIIAYVMYYCVVFTVIIVIVVCLSCFFSSLRGCNFFLVWKHALWLLFIFKCQEHTSFFSRVASRIFFFFFNSNFQYYYFSNRHSATK